MAFKGKEMHDYTKIDDFFTKVLQEIAGKLGGNQRPVASNPASEAASGAGAGDEDVPF